MNRKNLLICMAAALVLLCLLAIRPAMAQPTDPMTQQLGGEWRFSMDRDDVGVNQQWFNKDLADKIKLPGILQSQGYGDDISIDTPWVAALPRDMRWYLLPQYAAYTKPGNIKVPYLSQPPKHYLGVAWYQRDIEVPQAWQGKRLHLLLERPRWETTVWVDDQKIGSNNSLCAPHEYSLGIVAPGKHRLSIRCDTRMNIVPNYRPDGHSVSDALGYSWNGIAGHIELNATSPVWIDDAQVFPNVEKKSALIKLTIGNVTGAAGTGTIAVGTATTDAKWDEKGGTAELEVPLGDGAQTWDEFHPVLQHLTVALKGGAADDRREVTFGLREIKASGKEFMLNGHEINLRGTHSGGDFPLTGYPATDVASWKRIIQTCKDYGLNHMRFHSWCPPDEAFTAADELGFYFQVECGMWNPFNPGDRMSQMLELETARIMHAYGNHPSFLLLSASNETSGRWQAVLNPWAANWYKTDPRRLYATNTGRSSPTDAGGAQYAITPYRGNPGWFGRDYARSLQNAIMPDLGHEVGQWCSYPDFDVIKKFTGYLQPGNYEIFRDTAIAHGVLDMNKQWAWASGKFQLACYKQEIEANLRTPGAAGFQLLDLHDYLGQGGALVGILDAFWESKGYVTPAEFRRFCNTTVPLARLHQPVMNTSDPFDVDVEIAHYGPAPIIGAKPVWKIVDLNGQVATSGEFASKDIPIGKNIPLGKVTVDLTKLKAPQQYKLVVGLQGTQFENDWDFWLYPANVDTSVPSDVLLTRDWDQAKAKLAEGGKVLFVPTAANLDSTCPPLNNVPIFWNRLMNPKASGEGMLGLLCEDKHPALAEFPTEKFCDWEWNELVRNVRAVNVEKAPKELQPIVEAVDDWSRNYKLGVVFESKVGNGRLVVCAINLDAAPQAVEPAPAPAPASAPARGPAFGRGAARGPAPDNPAVQMGAKQLRRSLLQYMASDKFQPPVSMSIEQASSLFVGPSANPTTAPEFRPGALPGDIIEAPNAPRPAAR